RPQRLGGRYELMDTIFGAGINSADVEIGQGIDIFGASNEGDTDLSRPLGDPEFTKINADIQRLQRIVPGVNLLLGARGQLSSGALLSAEEFGVGGMNIGRGYDPSEIVGDQGIAGKAEIQWNRPMQWDAVDDYQLYGFLDAGRVWNDDASTSSLKKESVTSTGVGIRADLIKDTEAGLAIAFPISRDVDTRGDRSPKLYFNLSRRF
ncbi:MAG: BamA/TamA family outer membrane protein, partial [Alphaproteobacteria bacterium]|nr:BamA/TamA family outer membrane protein [Alphaproteobacteria bacterium]